MYQLIRILTVAVCLCTAAPAFATDYYVSATGNDSAAGTTIATAWRTLSRPNTTTFRAGDRLLLQGGATFTGTLTIDASDGGTYTAPITVASYGVGRAVIAAGSANGIAVLNRAAIRISNVRVTGAGAAGTSGIVVYTDASSAAPLPFVRIEDVEVSGFGQDGIQIGTWGQGAGFSDVRIVRTLAHDNGRTGILTFAERPNVHRDVYIGYSKAFNNRGISGQSVNSGSGIVLGGVAGGTVERSVAHDNGSLSTAREGPVGIWAYDSTRVLIQHNESYRNRTGGPADGGGFDLDQNVTDSVVQFNYSHDNDGAGYLIAHAYGNDNHRGNIIRYNVSQNDGRRNGYAAIEIWGRTLDAAIYHNTVFLTAAATVPRAIRIHNSSIAGVRSRNVRVLNNVLYAAGSSPLVDVSADQVAGVPAIFAGNRYHAPDGFEIRWGASRFTSLAAFRNAGQEQLSGSPMGTMGDPGLQAAGLGATFDDATRLEALDAYRLAPTSMARDTGVDVALFGVPAADRDFYGTPLGSSAPDPGAHEAVCPACPTAEQTPAEQTLWASEARLLAGAWRREADTTAAGGWKLRHPDAAAAKVVAPLAAPVHYFELEVDVVAGRLYRLWLRGRADNNSPYNDSVFVQFTDSLDEKGGAAYQIGSTSALAVNLEDCSGCGLAGWMWQDTGWPEGVLGPKVAFASGGRKRLRVQTREDGVAIDQVVLSADTFLTRGPGALKNDNSILARDTATADEIIVHVGAQGAATYSGNWTTRADASAASGVAAWNPDRSQPKRAAASASPADYLEVSFVAAANTPYRLWVRMRAQNDSTANDSVFVQVDDAVDGTGAAVWPIGTAAAGIIVLQDYTGAPIRGWGWNDTGWAVMADPIAFRTSGTHRLRFQPREDGVMIDQIVLSPERFFAASPGATLSDATIVR